MPFKPDFSSHRPDPRLLPFQDRVARVFREDEEVGLLLVQLDAYARQASGHLWWKRFRAPEDAVELWWIIDGQFSDGYITGAEVSAEVNDWVAGRFRLRSETLRVQWTSPDQSAHLRKTRFD